MNVKLENKEEESNFSELIVEGGKFGISGLFKMIKTIVLFSILNIVLCYYFLKATSNFGNGWYIILVIILGFIFTFFAAYKTYRYLLIHVFIGIYEQLEPLFKGVSTFVIDKSEDLINGKTNLKNAKNTKSIDVKEILSSNYDKVPKVFKIGMTFIINRIPFVEMLADLKEEMDEDNKEATSEQLLEKMNGFVQNSIFDNNTTKWMYWLVPLNIVVQLVFIYLK